MATSDLVGIIPLRDALLGCRDCELRATCHSPVPWSGPTHADILMFGEAPGEREDLSLRPFTGPAGREFDNYLFDAYLNREDVRVSNIVRCRPPGNADPTWEQVQACWQWTVREIWECKPKVVVLLGRSAIRGFLGDVSVDETHGRAYEVAIPADPTTSEQSGADLVITVFCVTHPAAGLHQTREIVKIRSDFDKLREYLDTGHIARVEDEYPDPVYADLHGEEVTALAELIQSNGECSADTENTPDGKIWCASFSIEPGSGYVVWPEDLWRLKDTLEKYAKTTLHFAQHDVEMLRTVDIHIPGHLLGDTMIAAYLLGWPQSLKELGRSQCGVDMQDYLEVIRPYQDQLTDRFLRQCLGVPIPAKAKGDKRLSVHKKIERALNDLAKDPETDVVGRWIKWGDDEKRPLLEALGGADYWGPWLPKSTLFPMASLADVPKPLAIRYSARDADVTERVKLKVIAAMKAWSSFPNRTNTNTGEAN